MNQDILDSFIRELKDTEEFKRYDTQKEIVKKVPGLKEKLDDFRKQNYVLQNSPQDMDLLEKMDRFNEEYEEFTANPLVDDFLQAEADFCRMMQTINLAVVEALNFE